MEKHPKWGIQLPSPQPGACPQPWDGPNLFSPSPHCSLHTEPCNHHTRTDSTLSSPLRLFLEIIHVSRPSPRGPRGESQKPPPPV